jgi:drug/metabolite transporter (DMT)-like permease
VRLRALPDKAKLAICLAIVYVVWGAGYLFTKIGVSHLPPFLFGGTRFTIAGLLLVLYARGSGDPWPNWRRDWRRFAFLGVTMVLISNGGGTYALQYIASNELALLSTPTAIAVAVLGSRGPHGHALSARAVVGLLLGIAGVILVLVPKGPLSADHLLAKAVAVFASLSFAVGTIYSRGFRTDLSPSMLSGTQMLTGGVLLLALGFARGEAAHWQMNTGGFVALTYLVVFSSCMAYSAYAWLTRHSRPALIGSFSYVNPTIAALLGWVVLDESLSPLQLLGMATVIFGVVLVSLPGRGPSYA